MSTRPPSSQEIAEILDFLPQLYAEQFAPVKQWHGLAERADGKVSMPYPEYDKAVLAFFNVASKECWNDYSYSPEEAGKMLANEDGVKGASLAQVKTMLTYCARGERFGEGHWETMITQGHIRRLLQRLVVLGSSQSGETKF